MVADFGWHATVNAWTDDLVEHGDLFGSHRLPLMPEHMCHIDPEVRLDQAPFRLLLDGIRKHGW